MKEQRFAFRFDPTPAEAGFSLLRRRSVEAWHWVERRLPRSLRYRLLGFFAVSLIVPVLLTGSLVLLTVRRSLIDASLREQRETGRRIGERISAQVGNVKQVLLTVATRGAFSSTSTRDHADALRELTQNYPFLMECAVIGPSGWEIAKAVRSGGRVSVSRDYVNRRSREEFRRAVTGAPYVGPVFFTARERVPQMFVSVPLEGRRGVLLARLSLSNVQELVEEAAVGNSGLAYVVDPKGNLLAHPDSERVLNHENMAKRSVVREYLDGKSETLGTSLGGYHTHEGDGGQKTLSVHHRVAGLGWGIIVERPLREVLTPLRSLLRRVGFLVVVLGGGLLALGLSLARKILEPLRKLQEGAQTIGRGQLRHRIDIRSEDEIQTVAEEFNGMAESLENLEQTKRDIIHMIVHDLKSPLSGILGCLDYVLSGIPGAITPDQKKILSLGSKSGRDLSRLIQNLLDMAKMEEGRLELKRESFSLLELAAECVDDMEAHIHRENKVVSVEVPKSLPKFYADRDLLYRVLTNLLTNALKHTAQGAEIAIRASMTEDGSAMQVSVKDNGDGIPPEFLERVFEKFGQAEAKKRKFRMGVGLGLTFCKLAVEAHGGRIWVESELGKGSEFFVRLPVAEVPAESEAAAPAARG
jgi:signal transduction histidine kinase